MQKSVLLKSFSRFIKCDLALLIPSTMSVKDNRVSGIEARPTEDFPCLKEKQLSLKCLDANNYDYSKCQLAFENFKFCRQFWEEVRKYRRRFSVQPHMPAAEEREEIYKLYTATGKLPDYSKQER